MVENVVLALAERKVREYAAKSPHRHAEPSERHECEEFLRAGIEAYKWLRRAEETFREADYAGIAPFDPGTGSALCSLYETWLHASALAEEWASDLQEGGRPPENLECFRNARVDAEDLVSRRDWKSRAARARVLSAADEAW